jgi:DNA polymerase I-like protein with 3'-5' exonuclease and polymerase domains
MIYYLTNEQRLGNWDSNSIEYISPEMFINLFSTYCNTTNRMGYDLETTGLDPYTGKILLVTFGNEDHQFIIPGNRPEVYTAFEIIKQEEILLFAHHAKFDWKWTYYHYKVDLNLRCTMLMYQLLNAGLEEESSLDAVYLKLFKKYLPKTVRNSFIGKTDYKFTTGELSYAAKDVEMLVAIVDKLTPMIMSNHLHQVHELEQHCMKVYAEMELNGMYLNQDYWQTNIINRYEEAKKQVLDLMNDSLIKIAPQYENQNKSVNMFTGEVKYFKIVKGKPIPEEKCLINWSSSVQVEKLFKEVLNIDLNSTKKSSDTSLTGIENISQFCSPEFQKVDYNNLDEQLKAIEKIENPIPECLVVLKKLNKFLSTYGQALINCINPITGRIHPNINQLRADTGRISQDDPNLQNIPAKPSIFRKGFMAQKEGWMLLIRDYSGAELRILAEGSKDPTMIKAFQDKEDLISTMGSKAFEIKVSKKDTPDLRNITKTYVYGTVYGASYHKLAQVFGGDIKKAEEIHLKFSKAFPAMFEYLNNLGKQATKNFYSRSFPPFNRIKWYKEPDNNTPYKERLSKLSAIERAAKNHPMQGTCADIVKYATLKVYQYIKENKLDAKIVNQVHDEIVIEFNTLTVDGESFSKAVDQIMVNAAKVCIKTIPMETEGTISKHWEK